MSAGCSACTGGCLRPACALTYNGRGTPGCSSCPLPYLPGIFKLRKSLGSSAHIGFRAAVCMSIGGARTAAIQLLAFASSIYLNLPRRTLIFIYRSGLRAVRWKQLPDTYFIQGENYRISISLINSNVLAAFRLTCSHLGQVSEVVLK